MPSGNNDNRANQLNPQHPTYYLARGMVAAAAAAAAATATVMNQQNATRKKG